MLKKELVITNVDADSAEDILRKLATLFVKAGSAKESFVDAVIAREKVYPTGIPAEVFDIALPHTVSEHVIEPAIAVGVLVKPVEFRQMGSPEITLHPRLIIMMAIKDPKAQTLLLRKMMKLIQNDDALRDAAAAKDPADVVAILDPLLH